MHQVALLNTCSEVLTKARVFFYDRLIAAVLETGTDEEVTPKKANISLRWRQFALIQPSTRTRLDLRLILKRKKPAGRLEPAGSFNAMFTHRIKIAVESDVDAEVLGG